ncbi:unnamed protein product [marine sediment metagenome]|uniref:HNH nuclease domain-containing protein n=1 Tax=marine sediment metagenome TaxID=412755 RepID=X1K1Q1_9ZZZZ
MSFPEGNPIEPYPFEFDGELKKSIRRRDNYKCQLCGCPELENRRKLPIHHIDYDKENLNLDNLISLCDNCHSKVNGNREYWQRYFKSKITRLKNKKGLDKQFYLCKI